MQHNVLRQAGYTLSLAVLFLAGLPAASAQSNEDLEVTMDVIDSFSDIERSGFLTRRPDEASLFELDPGSEEDGDEARASLFEQFSAMDGDFLIKNEDDGFETDPVDDRSRQALETESDFDDGEDIELDVIDDPDPMT